MAIDKDLHRTLKMLRILHDYTITDLASALEISPGHLSEIENGKALPSISLLTRYSNTFQIPISSLLYIAEEGTYPAPAEKVRLKTKRSVVNILEKAIAALE